MNNRDASYAPWLQSAIFVCVSAHINPAAPPLTAVICRGTGRSKAADVHGDTHPLFPQLLFQWCQAAFLPQHAAVPPAGRRIHTEQLRRWASPTQWSEQTPPTRGSGGVNRSQWRKKLVSSCPQVKERSIRSAVLKRGGWNRSVRPGRKPRRQMDQAKLIFKCTFVGGGV